MINLQKVLALMGIHNFTSVFLRIINRLRKHLGLSVGFFPLTLLDLITSLKAKYSLKRTAMINMINMINNALTDISRQQTGKLVLVEIAFWSFLREIMQSLPHLRQGNVALRSNYNS